MNKTQAGKSSGPPIRKNLFLAAAVLQVGCCLIFAADVAVEISELTFHIWAEFLAVIALALGAYVSIVQYRHLLNRNFKIQ